MEATPVSVGSSQLLSFWKKTVQPTLCGDGDTFSFANRKNFIIRTSKDVIASQLPGFFTLISAYVTARHPTVTEVRLTQTEMEIMAVVHKLGSQQVIYADIQRKATTAWHLMLLLSYIADHWGLLANCKYSPIHSDHISD